MNAIEQIKESDREEKIISVERLAILELHTQLVDTQNDLTQLRKDFDDLQKRFSEQQEWMKRTQL
jgi:hypothetical protein